VRVFQGFAGEIPVSSEEAAKSGYYRLEAVYADRGAGPVPALTAAATVYLRQRLVEAELADEVRGPQILNSGNASGGRFIGAINHGHVLRFSGVQLDHVGALKLKIASAGAGGAIEIRLDSPDGELMAEVPVEVNGQWEQFYERTVSAGERSGRRDLFIRFTHPQQAGGLMNLDAIEFLPRAVQAVSGSR
jgi:cytochrome c